MPILNSIGALSIEEGGDNISGNLPVQKSFLKVVPSHTGDTFIIKQLRSFEIYEYSTDSGSYSLAYTIDTPTDFPTQSGVGHNILADDCDIGYGGDRVLVSFYDSNQYNSKVYAYQKVGGLWTLKNSVLDAGVNRNFRFGYSVSMSWADNGCVISSYYGSNAVTGFVYYYGDIWSSTSGTVRSTLPRVSTEVNGAVKEYPFSAQITKDGSYARAATQISGVYANTEVWSITTKSGTTLPLNAKWHEFSDKLNLLNREFSAKVLSGDKKVSFEMDAAMTYLKVTRDLVVVAPVLPTISVPVKTFTFETGVAVNRVVATSTGVGVPVYAISPALPTGLVFNTATATISGVATVASSVRLYTVTVGYGGDTASDTFSLDTVLPRTITAVSSSLSFIIGKPVASTNLVTISGFVGTVTYFISPGLPAGLVFNTATGAISGTPTDYALDSSYTVFARDSVTTKNTSFNLKVNSVITVTANKPYLKVTKDVAVPITYLITASGTFGKVSYSVIPALPDGLAFNTATGAISGTPTVDFDGGFYSFSVTDATGSSSSANIILTSRYFYILRNSGTTDPTNLHLKNVTGYRYVGGQGIFTNVPITDMSEAFQSKHTFNDPDISLWDTKEVTNMFSMFNTATSFNQSLNNWNTGNVTSMFGMFANATSFNGDISSWNTSKVTTMNQMFSRATSFNQSLNNWNTGNVTSMFGMFMDATSFNGVISSWNTINVVDMSLMFNNAILFNQPINGWNTINVVDMASMFEGAESFNQYIGKWNTRNVVSMFSMFSRATLFNQSINTWNVANVTNMAEMFANATSFNQSINTWNCNKVTAIDGMFYRATSYDQDISTIIFSTATAMNGFSLEANTNWISNRATKFPRVIFNGVVTTIPT